MFDDPNLPFAQQELEEARRLGRQDYEASALYRFATIYTNMAKAAEAQSAGDEARKYWLAAADYLRQVIPLAHATDNKNLEEGSLVAEEHARWRADGGESSAYYEQALSVARQIADRRRERMILLTMSVDFDSVRDRTNALEYHRQAVGVSREIGDQELLIDDLCMLGGDYMGQEADDYASALPCFEEALAISRSLESDDPLSTAGILSALGSAYSAANDFTKSVQSYEEAIAIQRENDSLAPVLVMNLNDLARLYMHPQHQDYPKATALFEEALARTRGTGDKRSEYYQLSNTSLVLAQVNQQQAMNFAEQALELARQIGDQPTVFQSLKSIGELHFRARNYEQAIKIYMDVLALQHQNNDSLSESHTLMRLSGMHKQIGNEREAVSYRKQSLLLSANNDNYRNYFSQFSLAGILEDEGDLANALEYAQRALDYFTEQASKEALKQNFEYWVQKAQDRIASIRQKLDTSDI